MPALRPLFALALAAPLSLATACSTSSDDDAPPAEPPAACAARGSLSPSGVALDGCGVHAALLPAVKLSGAWHRAEACQIEGDGLRCPLESLGDLRVSGPLPEVAVSFTPASSASVEALALDGEASVAGMTSWLSNGFQSWSQSGLVSESAFLADAELDKELARRGDDEVLRPGNSLSWFYSYAGGGGHSLFVGATTAARFKPWVAFGDGRVRVACGGAGEAIEAEAGQEVRGERFRMEAGDDLPAMLARHASALASRRKATPARAEAGWNSWYELWDTVDEPAVRQNAALAQKALSGAMPEGSPPLRIVVDDGWEKAWGDWEPNERFPSGLDGLAHDLSSQGMTMGVWLAPLLASEKSAVYAAHPDWFLPDATYNHAKNGVMRVLDVTRDEARAHLAEVITRLIGWGYTLLKIDFLFAGTFEGTRQKPATGMEAYALAMQTIRDAAGSSATLLAVGAPALPTLAYAEAWRVGPDIALEPTGVRFAYLAAQARTLSARHHLCAVTLCDTDPALLRVLAEGEVNVASWVASLGGGAFFLSDDLRALPGERLAWGVDRARVAQGLAGAPAVPVDLFPQGTTPKLSSVVTDLVTKKNSHVLPLVWKTASGATLSFNFGEDEASVGGATVPPHGAVVR